MTTDTNDIQMIRDGARTLASQFDLDYWSEHDKEHKYPEDFIRAFADGGWLGTMIPEEYGGMGLGLEAACAMLQEASYYGGANASSSLHFNIFAPGPVIHHGSEAMKHKYLPDVASGKTRMCFAVTEPTCGVDTSRTSTRAERRDGRWVINGQKVWISNAQNATRTLLLTRTSPRDPARPYDGMTIFFTDMNRKAITVTKIDKMARNAVDSNELFIENLEVGDEDVVGEVGKGFKYLLDGLNPERIVIAWGQLGLARRALDLAVNYANTRVVFDRPIGKNQAIAHPLADSWIRMQAAQMIAERAARLFDEKKPCGPEANAAKFLATEAAFEVCDRAMQTHGGYCYATEYHIERLWREARLLKIAPVSQEMVLNYVSEKVLGLPKSY